MTTIDRFRIVNTEGLYSPGGQCLSKFTKNGKSWRSLGHLRAHLSGIGSGLRLYYNSNCYTEHEQYTLSSKTKMSVSDLLDSLTSSKQERIASEKAAELRRRESEEKRLLAALKEKYE